MVVLATGSRREAAWEASTSPERASINAQARASSRAEQGKQGHAEVHTPKTYEVQSGDTLTSIAHENGVPVARILRLNPGVDPQILISGEKLKLR